MKATLFTIALLIALSSINAQMAVRRPTHHSSGGHHVKIRVHVHANKAAAKTKAAPKAPTAVKQLEHRFNVGMAKGQKIPAKIQVAMKKLHAKVQDTKVGDIGMYHYLLVYVTATKHGHKVHHAVVKPTKNPKMHGKIRVKLHKNKLIGKNSANKTRV